MVGGKKLFLEVVVFTLLYHFSNGRSEMRVARQGQVLDDTCSLFEAAPSIDLFDGGEISTCDGLGNVHHFM